MEWGKYQLDEVTKEVLPAEVVRYFADKKENCMKSAGASDFTLNDLAKDG